MFYHLLYPLHSYFGAFNVFRYITFRTAMATVTALLVSLLLGPVLIRRLREFQIGQEIREEGPASHRSKRGTPTMGGLLIITAVVLPTLLWADLGNVFVWIAVASTLLRGAFFEHVQGSVTPLTFRPPATLEMAVMFARRFVVSPLISLMQDRRGQGATHGKWPDLRSFRRFLAGLCWPERAGCRVEVGPEVGPPSTYARWGSSSADGLALPDPIGSFASASCPSSRSDHPVPVG